MSRVKIILASLGILVLLLIGGLALMLRDQTEAIPDSLAEIDTTTADPMAVVIPDESQPALALAQLKGSRVFLMLENKDSWQTEEGRPRNRALNRWIFPDDVKGFFVTDLDGLGLFKGKITEIMSAFRPEMRFPAYLDFEGALFTAFKMPRGHSGIVVLDQEGEITFRHSGPLNDQQLAEIQLLLSAHEPKNAPAPAFVAGDLSNQACAGKICVLAFLANPVKRSDIPGGEGGFRGDRDEGWENFNKPDIRLAGVMVRTDDKVARDAIEGVVIGEITDFRFKHWATAAPDTADSARAAFGLKDGEAGLVVINAKGELVLRETGLIRFYKFGTLADHLGIADIEDGSEEHGKRG